MQTKLSVIDVDGPIVNTIIFPYPYPINEKEEQINAKFLIKNTKFTRFAKLRLRFVRGDKVVVTGRKEKYLKRNTEILIKKLFPFSDVPIYFYPDDLSYTTDDYFKFKAKKISAISINYKSIDVYDDDLELCIYLFNLWNNPYENHDFSPHDTRIFWIPSDKSLKKILLTQNNIDYYISQLEDENDRKMDEFFDSYRPESQEGYTPPTASETISIIFKDETFSDDEQDIIDNMLAALENFDEQKTDAHEIIEDAAEKLANQILQNYRFDNEVIDELKENASLYLWYLYNGPPEPSWL